MNLFNNTQPKQPQEPKIVHKRHTRAAAKKAASLGSVTIEPVYAKTERPSLLMFTLTVIYKSLYILGITVMRRRLRLFRRFHKFRHKLWQNFLTWLELTLRRAGRVFKGFVSRMNSPFLRIGRTYAEVRPEIRRMRAKGQIPFRAYAAVAEAIGRLVLKILTTAFNYVAPVAAAIVFVTVITRGINEPRVYVIEYRGQTIGYIDNESVFTAATQDVQSRVTMDGDGAFPIFEPHSTLMTLAQFEQLKGENKIPADAGKLAREELADKLIQYSGSEVSEAYGLYIDDRFLGALLDKDTVLNEFQKILAGNRTGKPDEELKFEKRIRLTKPGLYPKSSLTTEENVLNIINSKINTDQIYVVKSGDTPTGIADKTGVPYAVLKEMNPDIEDKLVEGMEIYTQIAAPFMTVSNNYTDIVDEIIPFETVETQNATYARGYRDVYQEGVDGERRVTYKVKVINGLEAERVELTSQVLKTPVEEKVTVGVNNPATIVSTPTQPSGSSSSGSAVASSSGFLWPVGTGGYITCGLNGYWGHTGIDIGGTGSGSPILASASGTVVKAVNGWTGYGRYIIIDHGNGYQTYYAHNSALYVSVGDKVAQGQVIAAMGRTGNAYGVHLHFEVRLNGKIQNPVNYVGSR